MSVINFPDPSQSPWTNTSTGIIYTYDDGAWKVTGATGFQPTIVATSFLRLTLKATESSPRVKIIFFAVIFMIMPLLMCLLLLLLQSFLLCNTSKILLLFHHLV